MEHVSAGPEKGIVYASYSQAVQWISGLDDQGLLALVARLGERPRSDRSLMELARGIALHEFDGRNVCSTIVRTGIPGLFDRDPRALLVMEQVLAGVESVTGGYACETDEDAQDIVWTSMALARHVHNAESAEDLWRYVRALEAKNAPHFETGSDWFTGGELAAALQRCAISDDGRAGIRYVGVENGFMTEGEYEELVSREKDWRASLSRAATQYGYKYGNACGPFDVDRARKCFEETKTAFYFISSPMAASRRLSSDVPAVRPVTASGSVRTYEEFRKKEHAGGFSVYGYWFSPDGGVHAMKEFQAHDQWIRQNRDGAPGLAGGRNEAWSLGWVSMTMADEKSMAANIAFRPDGPCSKALKAAARLVKRGGDFTTAVVEAYDADHQTLSYEFFDDVAVASRRLNEMSRGEAVISQPESYTP